MNNPFKRKMYEIHEDWQLHQMTYVASAAFLLLLIAILIVVFQGH